MIVLCDNSALSALAELEWMELLPKLHPRICITRSVLGEAMHPHAPLLLHAWLQTPPDWLEVLDDPGEVLPEVCSLGRGEATSISLAWEHRGHSFLVLDDGPARAITQSLGLPMTGLLGLLVKAAALNLIDFEIVPERLKSIGFRISGTLISQARISLAKRRKQTSES